MHPSRRPAGYTVQKQAVQEQAHRSWLSPFKRKLGGRRKREIVS
jgi:hypothetical protein